MRRTEKLEVSIPPEAAQLIRDRVANGTYKSADDVVSAAVFHLALEEAAAWDPPDDLLRRLVDEADADSTTYSIEEVHESLLDHVKPSLATRDKKIAR